MERGAFKVGLPALPPLPPPPLPPPPPACHCLGQTADYKPLRIHHISRRCDQVWENMLSSTHRFRYHLTKRDEEEEEEED